MPSTPFCRIKSNIQLPVSAQMPANAACVIRLGSKLLTVTHRLSGKYDLPGGTTDNVETPQCTAHRETWEETGFNVEVGEQLGINENGLQYYSCILSGNFNGELQNFPVPQWSNTEVESIQLINPFVITEKHWRFENRLVSLRSMFNQVPDSKTSTADRQSPVESQ